MDTFTPIMSKKDLKALCTEATVMESTPLSQARYAIKSIEYIRDKYKPKRLSIEDREAIKNIKRSLKKHPWEDLDEDLPSIGRQEST